MLEPLGKGLLGTILRYGYEVRSDMVYFAQAVAVHPFEHGNRLRLTFWKARRQNSIPANSRTYMKRR